MIYGSVCSGIEAATQAWEPLGWRAAWFSEIEKFPSAVLAHRHHNVPNLGDMTRLHEKEEFRNQSIDLLVGGTPCQSFSVAGLRKGMDDPRGNLALVFLGIANAKRPRWIVWENVPGILSSKSGEDFAAFISGMAELGYGVAYRVLDAQYFGVPQRRRRVFVVGYLGDWRRAAAVLFEPEGLRRNPAPSGKARTGVAALTAAGVGTCGADDNQAQAGHLIAHTLKGEGHDASEDGTGRGVPLAVCYDMRGNGDGKTVPTMTGDHASRPTDYTPIVFTQNQQGDVLTGKTAPAMGTNSNASGRNTPKIFQQNSRSEVRDMGDRSGAVTSGPGAQCQNYLKDGMIVRRLTPRECERLQGFPDDYTLIPWRGKSVAECPDGPRYKALGNSMAVPVMHWIGRRIQIVEEITNDPPKIK